MNYKRTYTYILSKLPYDLISLYTNEISKKLFYIICLIFSNNFPRPLAILVKTTTKSFGVYTNTVQDPILCFKVLNIFGEKHNISFKNILNQSRKTHSFCFVLMWLSLQCGYCPQTLCIFCAILYILQRFNSKTYHILLVITVGKLYTQVSTNIEF